MLRFGRKLTAAPCLWRHFYVELNTQKKPRCAQKSPSSVQESPEIWGQQLPPATRHQPEPIRTVTFWDIHIFPSCFRVEPEQGLGFRNEHCCCAPLLQTSAQCYLCARTVLVWNDPHSATSGTVLLVCKDPDGATCVQGPNYLLLRNAPDSATCVQCYLCAMLLVCSATCVQCYLCAMTLFPNATTQKSLKPRTCT